MDTLTLPDTALKHRFVAVNGVRLHVAEAGDGPPVVLLHGFPEFWWGWRRQIPALADAGFRAIAPDLRGYNLSDKPAAISAYRLDALADDIAGLVRSLGAGAVPVVGHDWGGVVAWRLAMRHPECVSRLVVLNAPHPAITRRELGTLGQLLRFWYVFFFQVPWLPEALIRARGFALLTKAFRDAATRPDTFPPADVAVYREALDRPGALTAALNYYRAAFRQMFSGRGSRVIAAPTLLLWGDRDVALNRRFTQGLEPWVPDLRIVRYPDAGHFVQHEAADDVSRRLVEFLRE